MKRTTYLLLLIALLSACGNRPQQAAEQTVSDDPTILFELEHALTEAIIQDAFSPPVASRVYVYSNLAAQQVMAHYTEGAVFYTDRLRDFGPVPTLDVSGTERDLVMITAFSTVAKELVYRDHVLDSAVVRIRETMGDISEDVATASLAIADSISAHIIRRASMDGYRETRGMPRYSPLEGDDKWEPTPPGYTDALEPHWQRILPFTLDSAAQYFIPYRFEYSTDTESEFYQVITKEVYDSVKANNEEYTMIAKFWDCNPFLTKQVGHLMYHIRQLTPGGHWIGITETVGRDSELGLTESAELMARVSVAMADGFISAWHSKYVTDFIRPETYINRYMDAEWRPVLESPHFPEYTSAHSTVSAAAAYVLTDHFGQDHAFMDSTEVPFGLPPREFNSFFEASDEASLSRILGGIHFRPAIEVGMEQGRLVGAHVLGRMQGGEEAH